MECTAKTVENVLPKMENNAEIENMLRFRITRAAMVLNKGGSCKVENK